jgi:hypothetical protein
MANAYAKATDLGLRDLDVIAKGNAAEIRALADHIVPEEEFPSGNAGDLAKMKYLARREIRDRLLDEADRAESIDRWVVCTPDSPNKEG